jgi:hypothetical protein
LPAEFFDMLLLNFPKNATARTKIGGSPSRGDVIMIANWAGARAVCDKVLVLWDGLQQAFTDCALILWRPLPQ